MKCHCIRRCLGKYLTVIHKIAKAFSKKKKDCCTCLASFMAVSLFSSPKIDESIPGTNPHVYVKVAIN